MLQHLTKRAAAFRRAVRNLGPALPRVVVALSERVFGVGRRFLPLGFIARSSGPAGGPDFDER
eukprot:5235674-Lingulodinium_polyedra.AAC.1